MPGGNPSADSVASTDPGGCYGIPFLAKVFSKQLPYRERHQSAKSWGCGGKAPVARIDFHTPRKTH
jgi:hypothetical protein